MLKNYENLKLLANESVPGEDFAVKFIIQDITAKEIEDGSSYFLLDICDSSFAMKARIDKDLFDLKFSHSMGSAVVYAEGKVYDIYNANKDRHRKIYKLSKMEIADDDYDQYIMNTNVDIRKSRALLKEQIEMIKNQKIKQLVLNVLEHNPDFYVCSAAKTIHHNYKYGLIEHTVNVARLAIEAAKLYYADGTVDMDYVISGALLHDIGKIMCYSKTDLAGINIQVNISDHIVHGYWIVRKEMEKLGFSNQMRDNILHIILSHHGELEFGSPVVPYTMEAVIVAYSDLLDSKTKATSQALVEIQGTTNNVTEYKNFAQGSLWSGKYINDNDMQFLK